jgi:hypothetical protein
MAIIRIEGGKWHGLNNKDGKMIATSMCDCDFCPTIVQEVNEGDTIISRIQVSLFGNLKRLKIISRSVYVHPKHPVTLDGVRWVAYEKELDAKP